ncbi:MAG: hypothetical protein ABR527_07360 [Gemmatimonadota bacterium]
MLQNGNPAAIIGQLRFLDLHGLDRGYLEEYVSNVYAVTPEDVSRLARSISTIRRWSSWSPATDR